MLFYKSCFGKIVLKRDKMENFVPYMIHYRWWPLVHTLRQKLGISTKNSFQSEQICIKRSFLDI